MHIRIEEEGDIKITKKLTIVGLWCIQWHPIGLSMKVVKVLKRERDNLTINTSKSFCLYRFNKRKYEKTQKTCSTRVENYLRIE